jgi:hypothetical protein
MPLVMLEGKWSHNTWFSEPLVVATRGMFEEKEKKKTAPKDTEGSTEGTPTADVYRLWSTESSSISETMERGHDSTEEVMRPPFNLFKRLLRTSCKNP